MEKLNVLGMCGSLRSGSYNRMLLKIAMGCASAAGAEVKEADLRALNLPIYDYDIEAAGMPEPVLQFKTMIEESEVILIASPEYNYAVSGVLKNAIDWASRGKKNAWGGKWAAIFGASTGPMGTVRGQFALRLILTSVNMNLLPQPQVFVSLADNAFSPDGSLVQKNLEDQLKRLVEKTMEAATKNRV
jgi:chromate reductase, NAD(P)H dehydrogenase (quinone)